jgi:hypothetical protein
MISLPTFMLGLFAWAGIAGGAFFLVPERHHEFIYLGIFLSFVVGCWLVFAGRVDI